VRVEERRVRGEQESWPSLTLTLTLTLIGWKREVDAEGARELSPATLACGEMTRTRGSGARGLTLTLALTHGVGTREKSGVERDKREEESDKERETADRRETKSASE